jgi:dipeptidyl-peptidase 4
MFSMTIRNVRDAGTVVSMISIGLSWCAAAETVPQTAAPSAPSALSAPSAQEARLSHALEYSSAALIAKIRNVDVTVHWIGDSDRFWITRQSPSGTQFVIIDAATARQSAPLDQAALAAELAKDGAPTVQAAADVVPSPDRRRAVFRRDCNLWLRDAETGSEQRLTADGVKDFGYGDIDGYLDLNKVTRRRLGQPDPLLGVIWSPSGRHLLALRQDLRATPERLMLTEYLPPDGQYAIPYPRRTAIAVDKQRPESYLTVIDSDSLKTRAVALDPQLLNDLALPYFTNRMIWWDKAETSAFLLTAIRGGKRYQLTRIDVASGRVAPALIVETARFNVRLNPSDYGRPNVHVLSSGREAVWYSERDGWGHLYLYDLTTGALKRQITRGPWVVADLLRVDESRRIAYFTAVGREPGRNPYYRHLYSVSLDGGAPKLLTPENADHEFNASGLAGLRPPYGSSLSPSGKYFVDVLSTTSQPAKALLRKADGRFVGDVLQSDASALQKLGWRPPEALVVKAADGTTDLYGVLFKPSDFDPRKRYPLIEVTYPGPQGRFGPTSFSDNFGSGAANASALAELGFVVLALDGRGTAYRSQRFHDAFLGSEDVFGAADHVAAIRNLAATRPYMDPDRVGVTGQSFGGYGSLRAMLLYPDFFKVGVSGVGPGAWQEFQQSISVERYFGVPDDRAVLDYYDLISNTRLAKRLKGKLLLIYGGIDENVPLKQAFVLIDALIKADVDFDTLLLPDAPHSAGLLPYSVERTLKYFKANLGDPISLGNATTGGTR